MAYRNREVEDTKMVKEAKDLVEGILFSCIVLLFQLHFVCHSLKT